MTNALYYNADKSRYELVEDGHTVFANCREKDDVLYIDYVEAPQELRGTGAAGRLMQQLTDMADQKGLKIIPICGYAASWLGRHHKQTD